MNEYIKHAVGSEWPMKIDSVNIISGKAYLFHKSKDPKERSKYYVKYLHGGSWGTVRNTKLRIQPLCEGCGKEATEVHHKTYDRLGKEFLFDLMSVCQECHSFIHSGRTFIPSIDRSEDKIHLPAVYKGMK
jgi:hypothetical protein